MHISKKFNIFLTIVAAVLLIVLVSLIVAFALSRNNSDPCQTDVITGSKDDPVVTDPDTHESVTTENPGDDPVTDKDKYICIDAGHGWSDRGSIASFTDADGNPVYESQINLEIAKYMRDELEAMGYKVVMIRENDNEISPAGIGTDGICNVHRRVDYINSRDDIALMFSIHCNSYSGASVYGTRIYYRQDVHPGVASLAAYMKEAYKESGTLEKDALLYPTGLPEGFYPLTASNAPSILVECGFITNRDDFDRLTDAGFQQRFAKDMASAVDRYMRENN